MIGAHSYIERLASADAINEPTQRRLRRAEVLAEWIDKDFRGAFAFLEHEDFRSISLPGIPQMIANRAGAADLILMTNAAALPVDTLLSVGRHLSAAQLVEVADSSHLIDSERLGSAAGVIGGLLAAQNLDSALQYAASLQIGEGGAAAYAGIIDQLSMGGSAEQAHEIFQALPEAARSHDSVLFAYGHAVRDRDPGEAIQALSSIRDPQYRTLALVSFSRKIEATAPGAAIQAIMNGLGEKGFDNHVPRVISTWSAHDPVAARDFLDSAAWIPVAQRDRLLAVVGQNSRAVKSAP